MADVYSVCQEYRILTLRQVYYRLVALYNYPNTLVFYKFLSRWVTKYRREDPWLDNKFVDPSRPLLVPPRPWKEGELWLEKDSLRTFLEGLAKRYRIPLVVQRGFGSRTMFRDALRRAREKGVRKIFLVLDFDPSGLCIERVDGREMGIDVARVALTYDQAKKLPPRRVNRRDTRARKYLAKYHDRCWELEALAPQELFRIIEEVLRWEVPAEYLREAEMREEAAKVAFELLKPMLERVEAAAYEFCLQGLSSEDIKRQLLGRFKLKEIKST